MVSPLSLCLSLTQGDSHSPLFRYFGSAEGSKCVEIAACENVKRSWVNYGQSRDWTSSEQGQVGQNSHRWNHLSPLFPTG